jgi:protein-arginine kinase activator protein McsA
MHGTNANQCKAPSQSSARNLCKAVQVTLARHVGKAPTKESANQLHKAVHARGRHLRKAVEGT